MPFFRNQATGLSHDLYESGSTLLELLFTLAILAVLSTALGYFYRDYISRAQMAAA